jgi:hypothetical protein
MMATCAHVCAAAAKEEVRTLAGVRPIVECVCDPSDPELSAAALDAAALLAINRAYYPQSGCT